MKPPHREPPPGDLRLDRERATQELKRFVDLVVREMGLAVQYEIVSTDAGPEEKRW